VSKEPTLKERENGPFKTNSVYFEMMRAWHARHGGPALEPRVTSIIEQHCWTGARILDAGCGEGSVARWLALQHPGCHFVGIDISPIGVSMARRDAPKNARFCLGSLHELPLESDSFDLVVSQSVIEHVQDWEAALREMYRVTMPGGKVLIRVGNGGRDKKVFWAALTDVVMRRNEVVACDPTFELNCGNYEQHMTNFDYQEIPSDVLTAALRRAGFTIVYFTTHQNKRRSGAPSVRGLLLSTIRLMPFWPFNHLGYTTIAVGRK
jgi:ubiquinone/menaquinone biosynthesis C-methylase UbiE